MKQAFGPGAALRAALQMTGSTYVIYAAGLLVSAMVARGVGPDEFGRYSYLVWLVGVLILVGNNGLTTSGIRFVSECLGRGSPVDAANVQGWLLKRQWACIAMASLLYLAAMRYFQPAGWESRSLWLFAAIVLASSIAKTMYIFNISIAKGHGRFDIEAYSGILISLLNAAAVFALWMTGAGLLAYLVLFALTCIAYAGYASLMMRRGGIRASFGSIDDVLLRRLRRHLLWTLLLTVAAVFSNKSIETWLLNDRVGAAEVGYFTIAAALTRGGLDLLSSGLNSVLMPSMAHAFGASGQQRVNEILSNSLRYFHFLGLMLAGVGVLWSDPAVTLMYGPRYAAVDDVLRIMVVVGGLTLSEGAFGALLSTTDNQRVRAIFASLSIVFTAVAAFALIPKYGLFGAVAAHAISRTLVFVLSLAGIVKIMELRLPWREIGLLFVAAAVAAVVAGAMLWLLPGLWTEFAAGIVFAAIYVGMTLRLRAWNHHDAVEIAMLVERFPALLGWLAPRVRRWRDGLDGARKPEP
ncbi:MAG: polysaccharide biosynthesis C-terminal domain-containing protein [Dokdonella sp.]